MYLILRLLIPKKKKIPQWIHLTHSLLELEQHTQISNFPSEMENNLNKKRRKKEFWHFFEAFSYFTAFQMSAKIRIFQKAVCWWLRESLSQYFVSVLHQPTLNLLLILSALALYLFPRHNKNWIQLFLLLNKLLQNISLATKCQKIINDKIANSCLMIVIYWNVFFFFF